jgi:hypothetical protein
VGREVGGGEGQRFEQLKDSKESKPRVLDGKRENDDTRGEQRKTGGTKCTKNWGSRQ